LKDKDKNPSLLFVATTLLTLGITACSSQDAYQLPAEPEVIASLERYSREYVLVPGDQLEVAVYRNSDISRVVTIRADGFVSLPLLDDVKAAELSISELDATITGRLSGRLVDPEVTIILVNPIEPMVYVYGDVGAVTAVPLRQAKTLAQAIAYVGGIPRDGAKGGIALVRLDDDGFLRMHFMDGETDGPIGPYLQFQNTSLRADDLIVVPESMRSQVGRFLTDFIVEPLSAVNLILSPYLQFELLAGLSD